MPLRPCDGQFKEPNRRDRPDCQRAAGASPPRQGITLRGGDFDRAFKSRFGCIPPRKFPQRAISSAYALTIERFASPPTRIFPAPAAFADRSVREFPAPVNAEIAAAGRALARRRAAGPPHCCGRRRVQAALFSLRSPNSLERRKQKQVGCIKPKAQCTFNARRGERASIRRAEH